MKMKNIWRAQWLLVLVLSLLLSACAKEEDTRSYQEVKIEGVKINNELFTPTYTNNVAQIIIPAGRDLSKVKLQLLVVNGSAEGFENNAVIDARKPLNISLKGDDGKQLNVVLKIQSPPSLSNFIIEGMSIPKADVHFGATSLIVQVPQATNLTSLKVSMEFLNGTLIDFTNGTSLDYTTPKTVKVKGADGETIYSYDLIITTEPIGPAVIKGFIVNGIPTDAVVMIDPATIVPYVTGLTNFAVADVTLQTGFGNTIDPAFTGKGLNLLSGTNKVKVTGSDGIQKEFTIGVPQISVPPVFAKDYASFNFGANDMVGAAFSGSNIVIANYSAVSTGVIGPNYYTLTGQFAGTLNKTGVVITHSLRKVASDANGALLVVPLGLSDAEQITYKWDNVTAAAVPYIKYSKASLGVSYTPRSAGINISGSLSGNATITIGMAQQSDIFVWTVTGGVLNPIPQKLTFPYDKASFYYAIESLPAGTPGYVGASVGTNFSGIISLSSTMTELHKQSGIVATDCKVIAHKGRTYLAYVAFSLGKGAYMRICDITDGQADSYRNPIFNVLMESTAANGNNTMDVDMAVINGKLHVLFACTNMGMNLYKLEN